VTGPAPSSARSAGNPPPRPPDVDTAFWLWLAAVPLLVTGYFVDVVMVPADGGGSPFVYLVTAVLLAVLAAVIVTFLFLMRAGYRWARTLLTGGGIASIVSVASGLFGVDRPPVAAVVFAVTGIVGAVLIAGGIFLLHRKDAHAFFVR
jgi:hypothetical protein